MNNILSQIILLVLSALMFAQKQTPIQPLSHRESLADLNQVQPEVNPEYERVSKEYKELIRKYPDKKELFYNLGNLNYLSGDSKSALQNYRNALLNEDPEKKSHALATRSGVPIIPSLLGSSPI